MFGYGILINGYQLQHFVTNILVTNLALISLWGPFLLRKSHHYMIFIVLEDFINNTTGYLTRISGPHQCAVCCLWIYLRNALCWSVFCQLHTKYIIYRQITPAYPPFLNVTSWLISDQPRKSTLPWLDRQQCARKANVIITRTVFYSITTSVCWTSLIDFFS